MNSTNPNPGHQRSTQDYFDDIGNSTPSYGGDSSGRSASTGHIQYQGFYPSSNFYQQRSSNEFQGSLPPGWQPAFGFQQQYHQQPPTAASNEVDPEELAGYARSVDESPWSGAGVGSINCPRLQHNSQRLSPTGFQNRAHTVTAVPLSPNPERVPLHGSRASNSESQESGYSSLNIGAQGTFQHPSQASQLQAEARENYGLLARPSPPKSVKSESQVQTTEETKRRRKVKIQIPPCEYCGKMLNNASDARKHLLTHSKPFMCDFESCSRVAGFATKNDLQRHRKSVHGAVPSLGKRFGHICRACPPPAPTSPPKWWPRQDNFAAHVKRKHLDWDPDELIKLSEAPKPDNAVSESGYHSQAPSVMTEDQRYQQDLNSPMDVSMSGQGPYQDSMTFDGPEYRHFDPFAGIGTGQVSDPYIEVREPMTHLQAHVSQGVETLRDTGFQLHSPVDSLLASPGAHRTAVPMVGIADVVYNTPLSPTFNNIDWSNPPVKRQKPNYMESSTNQQAPSYTSPTVPDTANSRSNSNSSSNPDDLSGNGTNSGGFACSQCSTHWKRECDLRKHMKRHTRPYGCTFPNCYKRFGSRNDWKRHENSQHFLQEMWRCGVESPTTAAAATTADSGSGEEGEGICGRLFYKGETFITHLAHHHSIPPHSNQSHQYRRTMHLGREGHHHFWCGLCNTLVTQPDPATANETFAEPQTSAWARRLKHIGDHFDKGGEHIGDWVCIEHNKKKGLITREDRKKARGQLGGSGFGRGKEESVELPEHGIPDVRDRIGEGPVDDDAEGESDGGW